MAYCIRVFLVAISIGYSPYVNAGSDYAVVKEINPKSIPVWSNTEKFTSFRIKKQKSGWNIGLYLKYIDQQYIKMHWWPRKKGQTGYKTGTSFNAEKKLPPTLHLLMLDILLDGKVFSSTKFNARVTAYGANYPKLPNYFTFFAKFSDGYRFKQKIKVVKKIIKQKRTKKTTENQTAKIKIYKTARGDPILLHGKCYIPDKSDSIVSAKFALLSHDVVTKGKEITLLESEFFQPIRLSISNIRVMIGRYAYNKAIGNMRYKLICKTKKSIILMNTVEVDYR